MRICSNEINRNTWRELFIVLSIIKTTLIHFKVSAAVK